MIKFKSD